MVLAGIVIFPSSSILAPIEIDTEVSRLVDETKSFVLSVESKTFSKTGSCAFIDAKREAKDKAFEKFS